MTINTLPAAPTRTMSAAEFVAAANTFLAALPTFSTQVNADLSALLTLSQLVSTSTTSLLIGTGSKSLTVQTAKAYLAGQTVRIYSTATPDNYMDGTVTSYDSGTGALVVNVTAVGGSGTLAAWTVILNGGLTTTTDLNAAVALRALLAGSASQVFSVAAATAAAHAMRWDTPNMASLTVSQAGGALTFAGIAHPLTFRSATLTNGSVSTIIADPADLVLPSGGTLGFTSGVQGTILVAEMNNGGVSEYAICNQAGGLQTDERNLISTTAIDAASDAANVWYSTTARSNLPYKIVGAVDVVNTAGAWGDPVLVQAAGGQTEFKSGSMVRLQTANGYGSTNTKIRRFTTTIENFGTAITYADSATAGASFTINESGAYAITYSDQFTGGAPLGVSLNSTELTTGLSGITAANRLSGAVTSAANFPSECSAVVYLKTGDVIRPHTDGNATGTSTWAGLFTITKV